MKSKMKLSQFLPCLEGNPKYHGLSDAIKSAIKENIPDANYEEIDVIRKYVADTIETKDINGNERTVERWVSTRHIDRDNEILLPEGCIYTDFEKGTRIPVLWCHDYTKQLGSDDWIKTYKSGIRVKTRYVIPDSSKGGELAELANYTWDMIKQGHLNTSSVGFIPLGGIENGEKGWGELVDALKDKWAESRKYFKGVKRIVTKWLLLEHSDVPVPSNINAVNIAISKGISLPSELKTPEVEEVVENIETGEKEKYKCECIKCDYKTELEEHCKDVPCPECGGTMRRADRPGAGQNSPDPDKTVEKEVEEKPEPLQPRLVEIPKKQPRLVPRQVGIVTKEEKSLQQILSEITDEAILKARGRL